MEYIPSKSRVDLYLSTNSTRRSPKWWSLTYIYHQTTLERVQVVEHISSKIRRRPIPITKQYSKGSLVVEPIPYKIQRRLISISKQPSNQAFEPSLQTKPPNQEDDPASVDALLPKRILRHVYTRLTTTRKPLLK